MFMLFQELDEVFPTISHVNSDWNSFVSIVQNVFRVFRSRIGHETEVLIIDEGVHKSIIYLHEKCHTMVSGSTRRKSDWRILNTQILKDPYPFWLLLSCVLLLPLPLLLLASGYNGRVQTLCPLHVCPTSLGLRLVLAFAALSDLCDQLLLYGLLFLKCEILHPFCLLLWVHLLCLLSLQLCSVYPDLIYAHFMFLFLFYIWVIQCQDLFYSCLMLRIFVQDFSFTAFHRKDIIVIDAILFVF